MAQNIEIPIDNVSSMLRGLGYTERHAQVDGNKIVLTGFQQGVRAFCVAKVEYNYRDREVVFFTPGTRVLFAVAEIEMHTRFEVVFNRARVVKKLEIDKIQYNKILGAKFWLRRFTKRIFPPPVVPVVPPPVVPVVPPPVVPVVPPPVDLDALLNNQPGLPNHLPNILDMFDMGDFEPEEATTRPQAIPPTPQQVGQHVAGQGNMQWFNNVANPQ